MHAFALPTSRRMLLASGGLVLALPRALFAQAPAQPGPVEAGWPHTVTGPGGSATVYQPQVVSWPGQTTLNARAAVAITRQGDKRPILGTVEITAQTSTDFATRTVALSDIRLVSSRFPMLDTSQAAQLEARIRAALPDIAYKRVPLDTILLSLRDGAEVPSDPAVNNDPPVIFYSARPASLVVFDGEPVLVPVKGSPLSVAVNTNWDVFFDPAGEGRWWLLDDGAWLEAAKAIGPWTPAGSLPEALRHLPDDPNLAEVRQAIPGRSLSPEAAPTIFVSTTPAEIIVTDGPPQFAAIPGTQVQLVTNGNSALFRHAGDGRFYYLVSGRWFSAARLEGPWRFATPDLPPDFAMIPPDSAAGSVLASVPGTAQAQEAVLQAQIPRQARLQRNAALQVTYAGAPEFRPIPGTGLRYAVNTPFEVLEVSGRYYCCHQGAWFVAPAPTGPWVLADSVPPGIHRIPPSHPLHNVTYVNVYEATPTTVTYGYTAGYLGALVAAGVLVYGTGYAYPPVVLPGPVPVYFPYPATYAGNVWYNPTTGSWARGGAVYGPYGGAGAFSAYNPTTGAYARGSSAWGAGGGWANASFANPATGRSGSTSQNWNPYGRWGSSEVSGPNQTVRTESGSNARGSAGAFSSTTGAEGAGVRGAGGNQAGAVRTQGGNVYAGADGNVYRKTDNGWQKYNNGSWQQVQQPSRNAAGGAGTPRQGSPGATQRSAPAQPAATQPRPEGARAAAGGGGAWQGREAGQGAGEGLEGRNFSQLEQDHQARQFGELRQRAFNGGGGGWGGLEGGLRGFGGFHRR